jgi:hypothetical protein
MRSSRFTARTQERRRNAAERNLLNEHLQHDIAIAGRCRD